MTATENDTVLRQQEPYFTTNH